MPPKKNPLNLNALQLRTLTLLAELARFLDLIPGQAMSLVALSSPVYRSRMGTIFTSGRPSLRRATLPGYAIGPCGSRSSARFSFVTLRTARF